MIDSKKIKLEEVYDAHEAFREAQRAAADAREAWIDAMVEAKKAKATQQEIAEQCVVEDDLRDEGDHLSRQRVAQFLSERKAFT